MIKIITGIGSRETPQHILAEMTKIGVWCKKNKVILRSGHADGADYAFEQGAQESCIAFVPWKTFNAKLKSKAKLIVPAFTAQMTATVHKYHPAPEKLSEAVVKIMARNAAQVLGEHLNEHTQCVVCYTNDGRASGGTGQAIRIADAYKIPVYNMYNESFSTAEKIIEILVK